MTWKLIPPEPKPTDSLVTIKSPLGWSVSIRNDGKLEYSEGYDPDEAARIFWESLGRGHKP